MPSIQLQDSKVDIGCGEFVVSASLLPGIGTACLLPATDNVMDSLSGEVVGMGNVLDGFPCTVLPNDLARS